MEYSQLVPTQEGPDLQSVTYPVFPVVVSHTPEQQRPVPHVAPFARLVYVQVPEEQVSVVHKFESSQEPHEPPHPSSPQFFPEQSGVQLLPSTTIPSTSIYLFTPSENDTMNLNVYVPGVALPLIVTTTL